MRPVFTWTDVASVILAAALITAAIVVYITARIWGWLHDRKKRPGNAKIPGP